MSTTDQLNAEPVMSGDLSEEDVNGDGIIDEMDRVRSDLGGDVQRLQSGVRNMLNWQSYVRSAPITSCIVAAALGYLLAPRRHRPIAVTLQPGEGSVASPASGYVAEKPPATPGLGTALMTMVMGGVTKAASVYLSDILAKEFLHPTRSEKSEPRQAGPGQNDPDYYED